MYTLALDTDNAIRFHSYGVLLNGQKIDDADGFANDGTISCNFARTSETRVVLNHSFDDIPQNVSQLTFERESLWNNLHTSAAIEVTDRVIMLQFTVNLETWSGPWSIRDYVDAVYRASMESEHSASISFTEENNLFNLAGFSFRCPIRPTGDSLEAEVEYWTAAVKPIIQCARVSLSAEAEKNTLVTLFDFPPSISTACEQYLLYFVQFLRDLGIEAGASIKHEAHQVLFSVTPLDGAEALDRIREALDTYLRLPDSAEFVAQAAGYGDIAVQQLQANIYHLKGQLAVSNAVLQARNAQIEALELSNFQYHQMLAAKQQIAAIPLLPPGKSKEDTEPLVPGVIEITKFEGKGFTVNFAEILRRLKRRFD